jgi:hypothetical protein
MEDNLHIAKKVCKALGLTETLLTYPKILKQRPTYIYLTAYSSELVITLERPKITDNEVSPPAYNHGRQWLTNKSPTINPTRRLSNALGPKGKAVWAFDSVELVDMDDQQKVHLFSSLRTVLSYLSTIRRQLVQSACEQIRCLNEMKGYIHRDIARYAEYLMPWDDVRLLPETIYTHHNGAWFTDGSGSTLHSLIYGNLEGWSVEKLYLQTDDLKPSTTLTRTVAAGAVGALPLVSVPYLAPILPFLVSPFSGPLISTLATLSVAPTILQDAIKAAVHSGKTIANGVMKVSVVVTSCFSPIAWETKKINIVTRLNQEIIAVIRSCTVYHGDVDTLYTAAMKGYGIDEVIEKLKVKDYVISDDVINSIKPRIIRYTCDTYGVLYN